MGRNFIFSTFLTFLQKKISHRATKSRVLLSKEGATPKAHVMKYYNDRQRAGGRMYSGGPKVSKNPMEFIFLQVDVALPTLLQKPRRI